MQERWFDIAEICLVGHVINPAVHAYPEVGSPFCPYCGAPTTCVCADCGASIPGEYRTGTLTVGTFIPPAYCGTCGSPHPWTVLRIEAACELADEMESLSSGERDMLKQSVLELARDTPSSAVATVRLKMLLAKVGTGAAEAFRRVLADVLTEAVKRALWGL
jgi:hypothetical protein